VSDITHNLQSRFQETQEELQHQREESEQLREAHGRQREEIVRLREADHQRRDREAQLEALVMEFVQAKELRGASVIWIIERLLAINNGTRQETPRQIAGAAMQVPVTVPFETQPLVSARNPDGDNLLTNWHLDSQTQQPEYSSAAYDNVRGSPHAGMTRPPSPRVNMGLAESLAPASTWDDTLGEFTVNASHLAKIDQFPKHAVS
jgi:hypothetical protein